MSLFSRARAIFAKKPDPAPVRAPVEVRDEDRLQVLVGRQKVITRGRGSVNGSEGLVRDAL